MDPFDTDATAAMIAAMDLEPSNLALAEHWLSLWQDGRLPPREAFRPARLKSFLPSLILFNVVPETSVTVRLAGTRYNHILGAELTGKDWIAQAPAHHQPVRLKLFSQIARGAIMLDHRRLAMSIGDPIVVEEIVLPFAPGADGVSPVLVHVNLKADQYLKIASVKEALSDPIDFRLLPLPVR